MQIFLKTGREYGISSGDSSKCSKTTRLTPSSEGNLPQGISRPGIQVSRRPAPGHQTPGYFGCRTPREVWHLGHKDHTISLAATGLPSCCGVQQHSLFKNNVHRYFFEENISPTENEVALFLLKTPFRSLQTTLKVASHYSVIATTQQGIFHTHSRRRGGGGPSHTL